ETCQEHLLGTPFGTGIYAWVFLDYRITSNVSLTPILTRDNFAVELGVAINRVPGYSPVPGADLMKKYNVSAQIVADYSVVVELPCTDDDIEADPVRRSGMGCYDGVDALHRAGMHCDEPIPPLWHWQVGEGLGLLLNVSAEEVEVFDVLHPVDVALCHRWSNESHPCEHLSPPGAFEGCANASFFNWSEPAREIICLPRGSCPTSAVSTWNGETIHADGAVFWNESEPAGGCNCSALEALRESQNVTNYTGIPFVEPVCLNLTLERYLPRDEHDRARVEALVGRQRPGGGAWPHELPLAAEEGAGLLAPADPLELWRVPFRIRTERDLVPVMANASFLASMAAALTAAGPAIAAMDPSALVL
ncbi:MAG: hypothetical protein VX747_04665, partial [Actinomycetota bacterium]|nr:hypothetical protein [Actinomycetota bacterium]